MKLPDEGDRKTQMDCQKVQDLDIIERYLVERLSGSEVEAFEQHYLECQRCFGELKMRHAAAIELSHQPIQLKPARSWWTPVSWQWALASTAAAILIIAGVLYLRPVEQARAPERQIAVVQQPSAAVLEQLASINPIPLYLPGVVRGVEGDAAFIKFQQGMDLYSMQKYTEAIGPLSEAARLDPSRPNIAFYLGISQLVSGNADAAIEQLSKVTARENPYSEESHWFLSKAYLKKRSFALARMELRTVASLRGPHSAMAQNVLEQIQNF